MADKLVDERAVVTLHADECRSCEWHTPFAETDEDRAVNADAQTDHARETGTPPVLALHGAARPIPPVLRLRGITMSELPRDLT